jgi:hypothetical protein
VGAVEKHCMNKMLRDDAQWALWYLIQHSEGTNSFLLMRCVNQGTLTLSVTDNAHLILKVVLQMIRDYAKLQGLQKFGCRVIRGVVEKWRGKPKSCCSELFQC